MEQYESLVRQVQMSSHAPHEEQDAFARLMEQFHGPALAWAYTMLGDSALAQDAVQEAFVTAYRNIEQLREPRAFPAWLRRIVQSQSHRLIRSRHLKNQSLEDIDVVTDQDNPEETAEQAETREQVRHALRTLSPSDREVIELYYMTGYAQNEIAGMLDLPLTTVKKRLQYARRRLKDALPQMQGPMSSLGGSFAAMPSWAALMEVDTLLYGYAASFTVQRPSMVLADADWSRAR